MNTSTGRSEAHPSDELALYALDALDDHERRPVEDHVARCSECRAKLAELHETLAALAPEEAPPAAVWEGIAASIDAATPPAVRSDDGDGEGDDAAAAGASARSGDSGDGDGVDAADGGASARSGDSGESDGVDAAGAGASARSGPGEPDPDGSVVRLGRTPGSRSRRRLQLGLVAAAVSLVAAATAGGVVGYLLGDADDDPADIGSLALEASADPDAVLATLTDQDGRPVARVVADADGAYMLLEGLQDLPEGRAYQLWSLTEAQPVSLGMLGRDGTNAVAFRLPPTITELAISVERTSGEAAPTGELLAAGSISRR